MMIIIDDHHHWTVLDHPGLDFGRSGTRLFLYNGLGYSQDGAAWRFRGCGESDDDDDDDDDDD